MRIRCDATRPSNESTTFVILLRHYLHYNVNQHFQGRAVKYGKIKLSQGGMRRRRWNMRLGGLRRKKRRIMKTVEKEGTDDKEEED